MVYVVENEAGDKIELRDVPKDVEVVVDEFINDLRGINMYDKELMNMQMKMVDIINHLNVALIGITMT